MRRTFTQNETLTLKSMKTGITETVIVRSTNRRGTRALVRNDKICDYLKYYNNLQNYTASSGHTNGKYSDRYILVEETA